MRERTPPSDRPFPRPLTLIVGAFVLLGLIYAWATPPLEASDELWHFGMVNAIAETGALPVQSPGTDTPWEQEGSQPPLYYLLAAALVRPIDRGDFDVLRQPNPHAKAGVPGAADNKNLVLHDTPHPAPNGTALAVYALRGLGIVLGAGSVVAVYHTARCAGSNRVEVLAAGLTAFNPMFLFISASVNNDNLIILLNSLILWQTVVMVSDGISLRRSVGIGLLLALAALTKLSGLVLVPVVVLAGLWRAWKHGEKRAFVQLIALSAGCGLVVAGWWYARNVALYGELFGTRTMVEVAGPRVEPFTLATLLDEFEGFRVGYWGWFGAVNITAPAWFYRLMDLVTVLAVAGGVLYLIRRRRQPTALAPVVPLLLTLLIGSIALIAWTAQTYASQGRLLFPFIAASSTLMALGLDTLTRHLPRQLPAIPGLIGGLALVAAALPFATIAPQYTPPAPMAALPATARPVYARFGEVALIGYETEDRRYEPGDSVPVTAYWQVIDRSERDLSLYLHAVDDGGNVIGRIDSFPGGGRLRTTTWAPNAIYADFYRIPLEADATGRSRLRVQVGWWHYESGTVAQAVDADGQPLESVMLDAGGFAGGQPDALPANLTRIEPVDFGGVLSLTGYALEGMELTLAWEATGVATDNYTVFAQVLDADNRIAAQGDAPPRLPTRYWRPGETDVTRHTLSRDAPLAPGVYRIVVGWYRPEDFARLPVNAPDYGYPLTELRVANGADPGE